MEDVVAEALRQWQRLHPDLDTLPIAVIGRLNRCHSLLQQTAQAPLARGGLARPEYDVLTALRRVGGDLTPTQLARETFASGAAVTKRLRLLEERGLVERRTDERDRRVSHLSLTERGQELIDWLLPEQVRYDASLLSELSTQRQRELADILSELLVLLEGRLGGLIT